MGSIAAYALLAIIVIGSCFGTGFAAGEHWELPAVQAAQLALSKQQAADAAADAAATARANAELNADQAQIGALQAKLAQESEADQARAAPIEQSIAAAANTAQDAKQAPVYDATFDQLRAIIQQGQ